MRVYFVFSIKNEFKNMYEGRENNLYKILKSIYNMQNTEAEYGYSLLKQIINPIEKDDIDREVYVKHHRDYPYSKRGNIHYYNQLYKDEISRMLIKNIYIRIETEQDNSTFFEILKKYSHNLFVCDFNKTNYFYIN